MSTQSCSRRSSQMPDQYRVLPSSVGSAEVKHIQFSVEELQRQVHVIYCCRDPVPDD